MHENKAENSIEIVLDNCLEEIICSGRTVEDCLAAYPEHAEELKPLLTTAKASYKAASISPDESFKARARYEFNSAVADMAQNRKTGWFNIRPVWAQAIAGVLIAVVVSGGSLVAAAGNSLPGQTLYGVKLASEQVRMGLTFSQSAKSEFYADLANRRVDEIVTLADRGQVDGIMEAASRIDDNLDTITVLNVKSVTTEGPPAPVSQDPEDVTPSYIEDGQILRNEIPELFSLHEEDTNLVASLRQKGRDGYLELISSFEKAPEHIKPALEEALVLYIIGYENAIYSAGQ